MPKSLKNRIELSFGSEIAVAEFQKDTILPVELGGMVASRSFEGGAPEEQLVFEAMLSTPRERLQLYRFKEDSRVITGEERLQKLEMVSIRTLDENIREQTRNYGKLGLFQISDLLPKEIQFAVWIDPSIVGSLEVDWRAGKLSGLSLTLECDCYVDTIKKAFTEIIYSAEKPDGSASIEGYVKRVEWRLL